MKPLALLVVAVGVLVLVPASNGNDACRYMKSRKGLSAYESGGPYTLGHFRLTKGRTDLPEFLWKHWHSNIKGVAEARVQTVDRGIVKVLYLIQPDAQGRWGIDVEMDRPMDPLCVISHAESLVREPIAKPEEDYPSQTLGLWPPDKLPQTSFRFRSERRKVIQSHLGPREQANQ
jgi:hypothetical protein